MKMSKKIIRILKYAFYRITFFLAYVLWIPVLTLVSIFVFGIANPVKILVTGHAYSFDWGDFDVFAEEKKNDEQKSKKQE